MQQKITKKNGAGFNSIGAVLPDRIKQYKLQKAFYKHQAIRFWQDAAQGFAEELGRETRAIDLKNGILIVACLSKELAYQIRILAARIIEQINQLIGKQVVYAISVEV